MQKVIKILLLSAFVAALTSCSYLEFPWVYRIDIQQGNIIDKKMVDQLEVGMTRRQVRYVMGTPLLEDAFHAKRWDYYFSLQKGNGGFQDKHIILHFDGDVLASMEGDLEFEDNLPSPEEIKEEANRDKIIPDDAEGGEVMDI